MSTIPIHSLYWPNMNSVIVDHHQACARKIGIEVNYTKEKVNHSHWMTDVAREELRTREAIAFMDIDCLAYSSTAVGRMIEFACKTGSFAGLAQSANHFQPSLPIYAAPSFLVITKASYDTLGRPHLREMKRLDAAQNLSAVADAVGFPYRALYPFGFHAEPDGGLWRLGNFGLYGIGTEYSGGFFHLFQSRETRSVELFRAKAEQILAGLPQDNVAPFLCQTLDVLPPVSVPAGKPWRQRMRRRLRRL